MMPAWLVAELVLAVHVVWVAVVVFSVPAIMIGARRRWGWIRQRRYRQIHLGMIGVVVAETLAGIACPLTVWEDAARRAAGEAGETGTFVGRLVRRLLFYDLPPWVFGVAYVAFLAVVIGLWFAVPPVARRTADQGGREAGD